MLHATLKSLWARRVRLMLSALSIVLGVAFVAGSLMFTNLLRAGFDQIVSGALGDVNVSAATGGVAGFENVNPAEQPRLTPAQVDLVAGVRGVEKAVGVASSTQVFPLDKDGDLLAFPGAPGIGMNWHDTPAAGGQTGARIVEGRAPAADDEVVADPATVRRGGYSVGDKVRVSTPLDGVRTYRLVGTGTFGAGATGGASYLFFTLDEARRITQGGADGYYALWVQTAPGTDAAEVAGEIGEVLPEGFVAETGEELAAMVQDQLDVGLGFVNTFLLVFAAIALLVATLLIVNTFSILVAQRSRELALLRAVGATRGQVRSSVLLEALVVGLIGATLGLVVGYALTWAILATVGALGVDLGPVTPTPTWQTVAASYAIGILVTLMAASVPAWRASKTRPVEALTAAAQTGPEKVGGTPMVGVAMVELGVAAVVCAVWLPVPVPLAWLGVGAALLLIGMVLAAALVGAPLVWLAGRLFQRLFGEVGRLARLNAVRQPRRTAATAATLMIGVTLITTVAVLASSTTTSIGNRLSADQRGDFVIAPVGYQPFDASLADRVGGVDGVAAAYAFHRGEAKLGDEPVSLLGASPEAVAEGSALRIVAGSFHADGDVLPAVIAADLATGSGIAIGRLVDLTGPKGTVQVLVTGVHDGGGGVAADVVITPEAMAGIVDTSMVSRVVVAAEAGADKVAVLEELRVLARDAPTVAVSGTSEYVAANVARFDQIFASIYALLALAIVISLLGIVNTLGLSVLERTREVGLLRAVGMTRRQLRTMVTLESVIVATLGALLGVLLGLATGSALVALLRDQGIDTLVVPGWQLTVFVAVAALMGVVAAFVPARRAALQDTLSSIASE